MSLPLPLDRIMTYVSVLSLFFSSDKQGHNLRVGYNENQSSFKQLVELKSSFSLYKRHFQTAEIDILKELNCLFPNKKNLYYSSEKLNVTFRDVLSNGFKVITDLKKDLSALPGHILGLRIRTKCFQRYTVLFAKKKSMTHIMLHSAGERACIG